MTAQAKPGGVEADWTRLASPNHTLAIYMGSDRAEETAARLIAAGRSPSTPVAIVENGSRPDERVLTGRLDGLGALVRGADLTGPALLFVGETAALSAAQLDVRAEVAAKIVTANRLSDGRVIYAGVDNQPVEHIDQALVLDDTAAEVVLADVAGRPDVFVNPYLFEVQNRTPSGRDRLKERIRSAGPTVGHSVVGGVG